MRRTLRLMLCVFFVAMGWGGQTGALALPFSIELEPGGRNGATGRESMPPFTVAIEARYLESYTPPWGSGTISLRRSRTFTIASATVEDDAFPLDVTVPVDAAELAAWRAYEPEFPESELVGFRVETYTRGVTRLRDALLDDNLTAVRFEVASLEVVRADATLFPPDGQINGIPAFSVLVGETRLTLIPEPALAGVFAGSGVLALRRRSR